MLPGARRRPPATEPRIRIYRAIAVQTVGAILCAAISFLLVAFLGRRLGTGAFGAYASVLSIAVVVLVAIEGGWPTLLYREAAGSSDPARVDPLARHALAYVVLAAGVAIAVAAAVPAGPPALPIALACMALVATTNLVSGRLRGEGAFGRDALWQVGARVASAAAIVVAITALGPSVTHVFAAWAAALLVLLVATGAPRLRSPRLRGLGASYPLALPLVAIDLLVAFLLRADIALLATFGLDASALSYYAAATRFNELGLLAVAPLANVMLRRVRVGRDVPGESRTWLGPCALAFAAGLAALAIAAVFPRAIVTLVFGEAFAGAAALLPYVMTALPFALANLLLVPTLIALDRERALAKWLAVGAIALLGGLLGGLAEGGARGAALGAAGAQALLLALLAGTAWRAVPVRAA